MTVVTPSVSAQTTHRKVMADIALECVLAEIPGPTEIQLTGTGLAAIVAPDLESALISRGFTLLKPDAPNARSQVAYDVEFADVALTRKGKNQLERVVSLGLSLTLSGSADDRISGSKTCRDSRSDIVGREEVASLGDPGYPETNPIIPAKGGWKRFIEPAVLLAASAVGTYLLFNLRSRRADSG